MGDGIQWLAASKLWITGVVFARGISADELAVRMGARPGTATEPISAVEVGELGMEIYRPNDHGDGVVRVGEHDGWSFAVEYGDSTGGELLAEISRDGVEAVHYSPMPEHPPATVFYARDGVPLCGFGLCEEQWRWGSEPDLLLPELVAAGVLQSDGQTRAREDEDYTDARRRTLGVVERRFGLALSPDHLGDALLPAYAVRGTPTMHVGDPDFEEIHAWATANGYELRPGRRTVPPAVRRAYRAANGR